MGVFTVLRFAAWIILRIAELLLLFRALLSFFSFSERLYDILCTVTEPIIMPIRLLLDKLGFNPLLPLDIPFLITFMLISILEAAVL